MKKLSLLLAAVATLAVAEGAARADLAGYVCDVTHYQYPGWGTVGYLDFSIYSGPHCTGSYLGSHYYCSTSATSSACAADSSKLLTEQALLSLRHELLESGRWGNYVISYATPCVNSSYTNVCGMAARFFQYANK
jgi:hypothetical protein